MYSRHHLVISLVVAVPFLGWYDRPGGWPALLAWAAAVGVLIDLDHFLLARWRTGSWAPLRRALSSPRIAAIDQERIFGPGDVGPMTRMASHLILAGTLCLVLVPISLPLAVATAAVLYAHVLGDALWDASKAHV